MPKMNIVRRKQINAPIGKVYDIISKMDTWKVWSPWLIMDKDATVNVSTDKKYYSWEGNRVGSGEMQVSKENNKDLVEYDLTFLKPWKSKAKVKMELSEREDGTEVTWHMDSSLPWFMFWMKKNMEAYVGSDYERGLNLLKDYAQDGAIHSKLNFLGDSQFEGCEYICIKRTCHMDEGPSKMEADFNELMAYAGDKKEANLERAFTIYHKWDFVKKQCSYTAGVPMTKLPGDLPAGISSGKIPAVKIKTVEHIGPYENLGNAWSTMYAMHRNKEFKPIKNVHPFETYGNDPKSTAPNELITRIHFPVKG